MAFHENRWLVVAGALIIQVCLGAIYSWSVFVNPLKDVFSFTTTQTQAIFSLALAAFALVMIFAGKLQDKKGPRTVATLGGIVLGAGYLLAAFSGDSFLLLALSVGIIGGAGIGFAYVCPIAACVKWFPDKRGMVTGFAVAGFGAGAWLFAKIASGFINAYGLSSAFMYLGMIFMVAVVTGAQLLRNPPAGWRPAGWQPPASKSATAVAMDFEWRDMVRHRQFWRLWLMFVFGAAAGLLVIGILKPFGIHSGLSTAAAAHAVGVLALFNGAGRILWGAISDRIGRKNAMMLMFLLQGVMMLALIKMGSNEMTLSIAAAWVGFNFGGNLALFPATTADFFGTRHVGINYGLMFTAYGVAGIAGPILAGSVFDMTGSYLWAFIPAGVACFAAAGISLGLKPPQHG
ncbi:MFS transporter, OFA family, oxalate/formate antiporter [Nitrosomonas marina]|uniref:MFS transporter, OFA family, oxalate/formate antiporter n=1 Tax=Nitrosomonas marina TaxID=917 RepID=A0A1I0A9L3_9PROT|nr:OFA family MFS transporter [Nitrosomonas marina]SES89927.1 MFS transporter, OFA family, oxalate/formate antiporter [Nitrosomonas marina]